MTMAKRFHSGSHWGVFSVEVADGKAVAARPFPTDPAPPPLIDSFLAANADGATRVTRPMVRKGWLESRRAGASTGGGAGRGVPSGSGAARGVPSGNGAARGAEPFVAVSWDEAERLVAAELERVKAAHGNQAIYAGSYGWASAGRLHYAQSSLKRFLGLFGGFTNSVGNYSNGAALVLLPHVLGSAQAASGPLTSWPAIIDNTKLLVAFGGVPLKNTQINHGGLPEHDDRLWQQRLADAGVEVLCIGPLRDDAAGIKTARWLPIRPNTDTALMLGLAHTLVAEDLHDRAFLDRCCTGFDRFRPYLMGESDGVAKSADWAAAICGVDADAIRLLARRMAAVRTMITACWSLQRADHGEQPFWMAVTLAAMLGQIGLPGGGVGFGYGCMGGIGTARARYVGPRLPTGPNPVKAYIPVARIADMLLHPGRPFDFDGKRMSYPDIRLIWWCGGNPFHHHQDINRLLDGWRRVDTVIVNEPWWTATARHADIVLPAATTLERNDIGAASVPAMLFAMQKAVEPPGEARTDFDIFGRLAARLGFADAFTEGRDEMGWLRHLYDLCRQQNAESGVEMPSFDEFWTTGTFEFPRPEKPYVLFESFRRDPAARPLKTPSGRIEIYSETIAGFGYDDCPGHAAWLEPAEWLGSPQAQRYSLHLVSNQPRTRLHGQLDSGPYSMSSKIAGREAVWINPADAAARGIADGDVVRLFNDRGACLAGARLTDEVMRGAVMLPTGAWYDPENARQPGTLDVHGNPNVLTLDKGTSKLAQGPTSQTALVEIERWQGVPPPVSVHRQPATA
jgi:biotin/methionine sulfoxide reductase